jgi:hypothetical protein
MFAGVAPGVVHFTTCCTLQQMGNAALSRPHCLAAACQELSQPHSESLLVEVTDWGRAEVTAMFSLRCRGGSVLCCAVLWVAVAQLLLPGAMHVLPVLCSCLWQVLFN